MTLKQSDGSGCSRTEGFIRGKKIEALLQASIESKLDIIALYGQPLWSPSVVAVKQILNDFRKSYGITYCRSPNFWHKGIPWIQIEINRALYEQVPSSSLPGQETEERALLLRETIWKVLTVFWDQVHN